MGCGFQQTVNPVNPKLNYKWKKGKIIGKGAFGTVYEGLNQSSGEIVAMKNFRLSDKISENFSLVNSIKKEVKLHRQLNHKNIVKYITIDVPPDKQSIDIILEYLPGGSLLERIKVFGPQEESLIKFYAQQILEGLVYLHSKNIIHRDLKCANVLLDKSGFVKLTDFGVAVKLATFNPTDLIGSPYWIAPEVLNNTGQDKTIDIWSFGCTLIELLTSHPPYYKEKMSIKEVFEKIKQGPPPIPPRASFRLADLISKCLVYDSSRRPSAAELLTHPFLTNDPLSYNSAVKNDQINLSVKTSNAFESRNFPVHSEEPIVVGATESMKKGAEAKKMEEFVKSPEMMILEKKFQNEIK